MKARVNTKFVVFIPFLYHTNTPFQSKVQLLFSKSTGDVLKIVSFKNDLGRSKKKLQMLLFAVESTGTSFCSLSSISSLLTFRT